MKFSILIFIFSVGAGAFQKTNIKIGSISLRVDMAKSEEEHEKGLMFRKSLKDSEGMLFIFKVEKILNFWMKNTFIDLDIGYFDAQKNLIDVQEMKATASEMESNLPTYPSKSPAKYALEVQKGWFKKHKIKLGEKLVLSE